MFQVKRFCSLGDCSYVSYFLTRSPIPNSGGFSGTKKLIGEESVCFRFGSSRRSARGARSAPCAFHSVCGGGAAVHDWVGCGRSGVLQRTGAWWCWKWCAISAMMSFCYCTEQFKSYIIYHGFGFNLGELNTINNFKPHFCLLLKWYRAFHRFRQTKLLDGGLVLGLSQFSILPQLPHKMMLGFKVFKIDFKISILHR
jgi:hypothetical protein